MAKTVVQRILSEPKKDVPLIDPFMQMIQVQMQEKMLEEMSLLRKAIESKPSVHSSHAGGG